MGEEGDPPCGRAGAAEPMEQDSKYFRFSIQPQVPNKIESLESNEVRVIG